METSKETTKRWYPLLRSTNSRAHVTEVVRQSVEETLNGLLDAEVDALCQASRYERSAGPVTMRGICKRRLVPSA